MNMFSKIVKKESTVAVIGLGYVGLPIALAFAKKVKVIGFDINEKNKITTNALEGLKVVDMIERIYALRPLNLIK